MEDDRCWQEFQCLGCAWTNRYSPRNDEHFCEVCVEDMASLKERIAAKIIEKGDWFIMPNVHNHIILPDQRDLPKRVNPITVCGMYPVPGSWARFWGIIEDIGCLDCLHSVVRDGHKIATLSNGTKHLQGITEPATKGE